MVEAELRQAILKTMAVLETKNFNHGSSGNISCRIADGMLITPTGANMGNTDASDLVRLDREGRVMGEGKPSSECFMHRAILEAFPATMAVVHTHADACVALSCLRRDIPAFHYMVAGFGGDDVRCARYATFGTDSLARAAVEALEGRTACLLANHGMIAVGRSLREALDTTIKLETLARQCLMSLSAGEPVLLPPDEMARVRERYRSYGRRV